MGLPKEKPSNIIIIEVLNLEILKDKNFVDFFSRSVREVRLPDVGFYVQPKEISRILEDHLTFPEKVIFVAESNDQYVGILMGSILDFPFTNNKMITDALFRVDQDFRGVGVGKRLVEAFAEWGKVRGANLMMIGINQYVGRDAIESTSAMERMGFKIFNYNYAMRI